MPVAEKKKSMAKAAALATSESGEPNRVTGYLTRATNFLKDVRNEMRKVVTPSRSEVQSTTTVVIVAVFIFAAYFYVIDSVFGSALKWLLHWLGGTQ